MALGASPEIPFEGAHHPVVAPSERKDSGGNGGDRSFVQKYRIFGICGADIVFSCGFFENSAEQFVGQTFSSKRAYVSTG